MSREEALIFQSYKESSIDLPVTDAFWKLLYRALDGRFMKTIVRPEKDAFENYCAARDGRFWKTIVRGLGRTLYENYCMRPGTDALWKLLYGLRRTLWKLLCFPRRTLLKTIVCDRFFGDIIGFTDQAENALLILSGWNWYLFPPQTRLRNFSETFPPTPWH